jgi:hypothetical protein
MSGVRTVLAAAVIVMMTSACSVEAPGADTEACEPACRDGEVCVKGECRLGCNSSCPDGLVCDRGVCVSPSSSCAPACDPGFSCNEVTHACVALPSITAVDGTGSADDDPSHTPRHLDDRLVVRGANLDGASFFLRGVTPSRTSTPLTPCAPPSDTEVRLALPTDILAGHYVLTAVNQAGGSCDADLRLLQGEPGQGLAGLVTTLVATASATPGTRSVLIDEPSTAPTSPHPG